MLTRAQENQKEAEKMNSSRVSVILQESEILMSSNKVETKCEEEKTHLIQPEEEYHEETPENGVQSRDMPDFSNERNSIQFISVSETSKIFDLD